MHLWPAEEQVSHPGHTPAATSEGSRSDCGPEGCQCPFRNTDVLYQNLYVFHIYLCCFQGHIIAQGTYNELQRSGLDVVSLLRSDEEHEHLSGTADPEKQSIHSQRTVHSHSSRCSQSSLLLLENNNTDQLPVGIFKNKDSVLTLQQELLQVWLWPQSCGWTCLQAEAVRTMAEETRAEGNVGCHIYLKYFFAGCNVLALILIILLSITAEVCHSSQPSVSHTDAWSYSHRWTLSPQVTYILQDWWLVYWWVPDLCWYPHWIFVKWPLVTRESCMIKQLC